MRLSVPDLLLNYLMKEASEAERPNIRLYWNEMLRKIGRRDINRFLRHLWVSKYGDLKSEALFSAMKKNIEINNLNSVEFTRDCAEECDKYVQLVEIDAEAMKGAAPYLRNLLRELDMQAVLPLLLSVHGPIPANEFVKILQLLLVYVTRYSVIAGQDPSGLETVLFTLAREIRSKLSNGSSSPQSCVKLIRQTLVQGSPTDAQVSANVAELLVAEDDAKYLLGQLAAYMESKTKELKPHQVNVEHIFPQHPGAEWTDEEKGELEPLLWHIGNLTVLGTRLNTSVANRGFMFKKDIYAKTSELKMAQAVAKDYKKWNAASVVKRAKTLAPLINEVWNFSNPSRV
jgi:hypothetical protein